MSGVDEPLEGSFGAQKYVVNDVLWGRELGVAIVPSHFHELEDSVDVPQDPLVGTKDSNDSRLSALEAFPSSHGHGSDDAGSGQVRKSEPRESSRMARTGLPWSHEEWALRIADTRCA